MNHQRQTDARRRWAYAILVALVLLGMLSCNSLRPGDTTTIVGTVTLTKDGGSWGILSVGGTTYFPINLPPEFAKEGFAVRVEARIRRDIAGIRPSGPFIEIVKIEPRR
jgi:hypothetical protein